MQTQPITGEEVDARDAFKLLRRVMLPPQWLPEGSEPLEVSAVKSAKVQQCSITSRHSKQILDRHSPCRCSWTVCADLLGRRLLAAKPMLSAEGDCAALQGLAFGMLKSTGTGVKFLRGSGFVIGRSVNSRRETRWSAPSYFHMDIRGLPPSFRGLSLDSLV